MIKKLILIALFTLTTAPVFAATYYVRSDGGNNSQCNGQTDHALAGASGTNCAFIHPVYALGARGASGVMVGGDTLIIRSQSGATQEKFVVGKTGQPVLGPNCASDVRMCDMKPIPSGPDAAHPTRVLGDHYNDANARSIRPQLWGTDRAYAVLSGSSNISIESLEITDHSACMQDGPLEGTIDGFPVQCVRGSGPYAERGLQLSGTNVTVKNVWVHGLGYKDVSVEGDFGNMLFENDDFITGKEAGWNSCETCAAMSASTTVTFLNTNVEWSGCGERYPLQSATINSSANVHHCASQGQNVVADGVAFGATGSLQSGSWRFIGGSYSHNTQDGIDLLHGFSTGTFLVSRIKAEGNAGQILKPVGVTSVIENSELIGNCGFFLGQSFTATKNASGTSTSFESNGSVCRAAYGIALAGLGAGTQVKMYGNTILSNHEQVIGLQGSGCNGSTVIDIRNNIFRGGRAFRQDTSIPGGLYSAGSNEEPVFIYKGGTDGGGGGSCGGSFGGVITEDYNTVFGMRNSNAGCVGSHSKCGQNPLFSGTIKQGPYSSPGYYTGTDYANQITLQSGSPAQYTGLNSLTFSNGSTDFNNTTRHNPPSMGALEFGSVDTCDNSVQDGDETGVDCGGSCTACPEENICDNDGVREPSNGEDCDTNDLNGKLCSDYGYELGAVTCSNACHFDTSGCSHSPGEGGGGSAIFRKVTIKRL